MFSGELALRQTSAIARAARRGWLRGSCRIALEAAVGERLAHRPLNAQRGGARRSVLAQIAFLDDALVRLAHALDAVLGLAAVVRQRADDLELAVGRRAQR